jgi:hypothetical protein
VLIHRPTVRPFFSGRRRNRLLPPCTAAGEEASWGSSARPLRACGSAMPSPGHPAGGYQPLTRSLLRPVHSLSR